MKSVMLTWKGHVDKEQGTALFTYDKLTVALDLPSFRQANDLVNFINSSLVLAGNARVGATAAMLRGVLDASTHQ